jgi:Zn-dependent protease
MSESDPTAAPISPVEATPAVTSAPSPAPDAQLEQLRESLRQRARPGSLTSKTLVFVASLGLFALSFKDRLATDLPLLVGVLFFHELGHYLAMRRWGFRDLRIFFVPFFGAAATGTRGSATAWQLGAVSLLGPAPGIFLGIGVALIGHRLESPLLRALALQLLLVNAFNLLPMVPLDGGQLFQSLLSGRNRYAEVGFTGVTALMLGAWSVYAHEKIFSWIAYVVLMSVPRLWSRRIAADSLRLEAVGWPTDPLALDDAQLRRLTEVTRQVQPNPTTTNSVRASLVVDILEKATCPLATLKQSVLLALAWAVTLVGALLGWVVLTWPPEPKWQPYSPPEGGYVVSFPRSPVDHSFTPEPPQKIIEVRDTFSWLGNQEYLVEMLIFQDGMGFASPNLPTQLEKAARGMAEHNHEEVLSVTEVDDQGKKGIEVRLRTKEGAALRARYFAEFNRLIRLTTTPAAELKGGYADEFFASFHLAPITAPAQTDEK